MNSDTVLVSSRSAGGSASSQRSPAPTGSPTVGPASPTIASDDPDGGQDNVPSGSWATSEESSSSEILYTMAPKKFEPFPRSVYFRPYRRPIPLERVEKSKKVPLMNKESRLPILDRHWHSSAVTWRTPKSFWILAKQWTPAASARAKADCTARLAARTRAAATDTVHDPSTLGEWPLPEKSCIEMFKHGFPNHHIRRNHVDPPSGSLDVAFETWLSSSNNDDRWVEAYNAWEASQEGSLQPIPPPRAPNNGDQQSLATGEGGTQHISLWRTARQVILNLGGGAGTPEPLDDEPLEEDGPLEEDEPANAPGGGPIHGHENDPLAEDIPNEFDNGSRIDDQGEYIPNEFEDDSRNDALVRSAPPCINDPSWIPQNDYGAYVYVPSSPKSHYSALSGDTTDLSRAASSHFHEQNEGEEDEEATAAILEGAATALGQLSNESGIPTSGDASDAPSSRRRFSFETQPSSGSRSKRTSSNLDGSIDWIPPSPSPRSRNTSSNMGDAMSEDDPLISPRPAPEPSTNNVPARSPPLEHAYNEVANIQPAVPSTSRRRRDLFRHALRREHLREHLLRIFRNMLVMGSQEKKLLRKKK